MASTRTSRTLCIGLALVGLALLPGCGGDKNEKLGKPLPAPDKPVKAGDYTPRTFKPRVTLTLGTGWVGASPERPDYFDIVRKQSVFQAISFERISKVYSPQNPTETGITNPPRDLIPWLSSHPRLKAGATKSVKVLGESGVQVDAQVKSVPKSKKTRPETCDRPCLPLFLPSDGEPVVYELGDRLRFIAVKVDGKPVLVTVAARSSEFNQLLPVAQKVLEQGRFSG